MKKNPGDALTADEIRALPNAGWAVSGMLLQSQPDHDVGRTGDMTEAEAARLKADLAARVADGSVKVTFMSVWDKCQVFQVHHVSGTMMKGTFDIQGLG